MSYKNLNNVNNLKDCFEHQKLMNINNVSKKYQLINDKMYLNRLIKEINKDDIISAINNIFNFIDPLCILQTIVNQCNNTKKMNEIKSILETSSSGKLIDKNNDYELTDMPKEIMRKVTNFCSRLDVINLKNTCSTICEVCFEEKIGRAHV